MRHFVVNSLAITLMLSFSVGSKAANDQVNIILIYADDISAREFPIYGSSVWLPRSLERALGLGW